MTTPTISAALDAFQQAANHGTAVHLSLELVQELRDALEAEPKGEGPSLDEVEELCAEFGFYLPDDEGRVCSKEVLLDVITAAITRWGTPTTPPAPEPGELGELVELLKLAGRWATSTGVQLDRLAALFEDQEAGLDALRRELEARQLKAAGAAVPAPRDVVAAILRLLDQAQFMQPGAQDRWEIENAATLLQQQATELAALRGVRFVAGQERINQLWVDALDPSTQVPLSAPQIKKLRKVLDDYCDQGPPNGTMWKSQELEELMWAVEGWVSAATPLPAPQAGDVQPPHPTFQDAIQCAINRRLHRSNDRLAAMVFLACSKNVSRDRRLRHCPTHGQQPPNAWGCPECVRELREELDAAQERLAETREALRRLQRWGGWPLSPVSRWDVDTTVAVADWLQSGMTGPLPPLPEHLAKREKADAGEHL